MSENLELVGKKTPIGGGGYNKTNLKQHNV